MSTTDQNLDLQIDALKRYGVPEALIFTDKMSGSSMKRPGLQAALQFAQHAGTELVIWKLDRLGRTLLRTMETIQLIDARGVRLVSLTEGFDFGTPMGKAMVQIAAVFAELERNMISERTKAGLARAREQGKIVGRANAMTPARIERAEEMMREGATAKEMLAELTQIDPKQSLSRARVYAWRSDYQALNPDDETDD